VSIGNNSEKQKESRSYYRAFQKVPPIVVEVSEAEISTFLGRIPMTVPKTTRHRLDYDSIYIVLFLYVERDE
jgi:hypothetical protein